jgi:hypothetical protein
VGELREREKHQDNDDSTDHPSFLHKPSSLYFMKSHPQLEMGSCSISRPSSIPQSRLRTRLGLS